MVFEGLTREVYKHLPDSMRQERVLRRQQERQEFFKASDEFMAELAMPLAELQRQQKMKKGEIEWPVVIFEGDETETISNSVRRDDEVKKTAKLQFEQSPKGIMVFLKWQEVSYKNDRVLGKNDDHAFLTGKAYRIVIDPKSQAVLEVQQREVNAERFSEEESSNGSLTLKASDSYNWLDRNLESVRKLPRKTMALQKATILLASRKIFKANNVKAPAWE